MQSMDIWELIEQAPEGTRAVADLYHWSTNYDPGDGPFSLFLDMIGWSDEEIGGAIYGPTARYAENFHKTSWDALLGYVELYKLGSALIEYADRPHDVRAFVDELMRAESEG